jgi:hypothetical protein
MDSYTSLPPPDQYRALVKRLQSSNYLLNKQLQHICLVNGLRTSGVKAELQRRILEGELPGSVAVLCKAQRLPCLPGLQLSTWTSRRSATRKR